MAYCTADEVINMIKSEMFDQIIGNEYIEDTKLKKAKVLALAEEAIVDADAEIDGYLMKRYSVPFQSGTKVINKFSKDIAIYNLISRAGINENEREKNYLTRYNAAISFLTKVASGLIDIGGNNATNAAPPKKGFQMHSNNRLFSRNSLTGM
jgi:phage gp36-like protein